MAKKVNIDGLADAVMKELDEYSKVIDTDMRKAVTKAGQTVRVEMELTDKSFEFWDATSNAMRVMPGKYEILVGTSSETADLKRATIDIQ